MARPPPRPRSRWVQALGTNHPATDYTNEPLLTLLYNTTRDDVIYALKQCAKRGHSLEPG